MKAIAIIGTSNSGKTTVCEGIIHGLRARGYTVGSVKEIHHSDFALDPDPAEDTARHRKAGSGLVTARAAGETDILYRSKLPMAEILRHYDHDFVILEGVSDCNVPRILTAHSTAEVQERADGRNIAVSGVLANTGLKKVLGLPVFNVRAELEALLDFVEERAFAPLPSFEPECCSRCGSSCRQLTEKIAWQKAKRDECVLWQAAVELYINDAPVPMVPFVQSILRNAVLGVVQELEGHQKHGTIKVKVRL